MLFYKQTKDCKGKEEEYAHADEYTNIFQGRLCQSNQERTVVNVQGCLNRQDS